MIKVLDLFSGTGGFSLGLKRAGGFETVAFCENEPSCQKVLKKYWPDLPIYNDVKLLPYDQFDGVDLICGGFPCQDISIAKQNAEGLDGEKSGLWRYFFQAIGEIRPRFALVENVFALKIRGLDRLIGDLGSIGYDATWTIYDSQYFGVPQRRRRMYILAVRDGIPANSDIFECDERSRLDAAKRVNSDKERRKRDYEARNGIGETIAYITRQRSDEYAATGLSSTLTKRDYKSYTDLVIHNEKIARRVMPHERLRFQGYPETYFDGLNLSLTDQFRMNGMTTNVVEYIGKRINATFQI